MSLDKTWYTLEEVMRKFGLEEHQIQKWVDEGVVRAEGADGGIERINIDDVELQVQEMTRI